ncbi:hypothetical protein P3G55_03170 [Leptospira sp. 96542]|nr:hypothetical protein [Leptospira sp. 96542]
MKKYLKHFPIFTPLLISIFVIHSLFVDYSVQFDEQSFRSQMEEETPISKPTPPKIETENGVVGRIFYLESFLQNLESRELPVDTDLEETKESLKRILVGQKLYLFLLIFYLLLCLSASVSYWKNAWFHKTLSYVLYPISLFVLFFKIFYQVSLISQGEILPIFMAVLLMITFVASIFSLRQIGKDVSKVEGFKALQFSSSLEEEGRAPTSTKSGIFFTPLTHFLLIIFIGILIGNLVYIPLFLLQKHYVSEFSYFIFFLLGLLSLFYIFNYKRVGGETANKSWQNLAVSFSYLQYRFLRNGVVGAFGTVLIIFFVTFLFSLLLFNIELIQSNLGLFGKTTEF